MMFDLVIADGLIVSAHNNYDVFKGSIGITDGLISEVSEVAIPRECAKEYVSAEGKIVMPGFVKGHCHGDMV